MEQAEQGPSEGAHHQTSFAAGRTKDDPPGAIPRGVLESPAALSDLHAELLHRRQNPPSEQTQIARRIEFADDGPRARDQRWG